MADKTEVNDAKIKQLLTAVEAKREALGTRPKIARETNGLFKFETGESFKILTTTDMQKFIDATAFLLRQQQLRDEAAEALGVEAVPFKWNGYTVEQWRDDFKARIAVLRYEREKKKLKDAEAILNKRMSEGTKTEMVLEDLAAYLT